MNGFSRLFFHGIAVDLILDFQAEQLICSIFETRPKFWNGREDAN